MACSAVPNSKTVVEGAVAEAAFADAKPFSHYQFVRMGYYMVAKDSTADHLVVNQVVGLKDSFKK